MNAETELLTAYREWRRLARAEARAISTRNWDLLADCQLAIADFQVLITRLTAAARSEWKTAGIDGPEKERHLQVCIQELIEITRQNQATLQRAKDQACARLAELGIVRQNIKRLRRSYGNVGGLLHVT
jgi:hypothetical protein